MTDLHFGEQRQYRSQNLFLMIRKQSKEWFEEHGIEKCKACDGTGLKASKLQSGGGYMWDNQSYCDKCYGVGYVGIKTALSFGTNEKYICPECQSIGCEQCDMTGFVDWITHAMGKVGD